VKLIEILVKELPKRGGWPEFALALTQDGDGSICLWEDVDVYQKGGSWEHPSGTGLLKYWCKNQAMKQAEDRSKAIITREQYEASLAANKPEWDAEGLPPVGCEFLFGTHQSKAKCIAVGRDVIFASTGNPDEKDGFYEEFVISIHHSEFRPIRSEADKKKYATIELMLSTFFGAPPVDEPNENDRVAMAELYDAIKSGKIVID